ncbi:hypothetical protein [Acidomonas methanolica]|uniref:Uncharacterized protein n=1 Tax=Acidomonas methanolica NBRC 104435 TaxID=1231351 RepID=A0A023D2F9_ACIMT|nr:hypothetical protein [Acidomonas methanolica]MBU2652841.1 hypothetical protein [Acidomonas methanolica]TCS31245.1 hypothetical protein EDC31_10387 [Acidomonas methanolica]GAJ27955.1 hypothetical protein Amme_011_055 [Acidomonas methanolica NBRC 104435]GBQ48453.1 hypothetical protein AA0498_0763 [Acidomonas methanolica]GEK98508.1 hypothetical protein AME01nite_10070 [Acidomonas methanolica NBRC 104435]
MSLLFTSIARLAWVVFAALCGPGILIGSAVACPSAERARGARRWGLLAACLAYYLVVGGTVYGLSRAVTRRRLQA